jgi:hypothetical protein
VPYEAQLLVLVKYVIIAGESYSNYLVDMKRWFRSVSFNESYRGKPDSYLVRDLGQLERFILGDAAPLSCKLTVDISDFSERVFTRGRALSAAVANLFASNGVRSLFTTEPIPVKEFMSKFSSSNYAFVLATEDVRPSERSGIRTSRLLANMVLVTADEYKRLRTTPIISLLRNLMSRGDDVAAQVLESQMLSIDALKYLENKQYDKFLLSRAVDMYSKAKAVVNC